MQRKFRFGKFLRSLVKGSTVFVLIGCLLLSNASSALAARGGRMGGGSFRAPSRSYSPPSTRSYNSGGGYYGGGGGFGFPFILPFIGFGGGGLFGLLIFMAVAGILINGFRRAFSGASNDEGGYSEYSSNPSVTLAQLQVGLLAGARTLQEDLERIARTSNTSTNEGLAGMLQETTLALLRHPEFWVYGDADAQPTRLQAAENAFNRLSLSERSKFTGENLSNYNGRLLEENDAFVKEGSSSDLLQAPPEYIVVTILVATQGALELPAITSSEDLRQSLRRLGAVSSENLLAVEVLWTPEDPSDSLSAEDLLTTYPELKAV